MINNFKKIINIAGAVLVGSLLLQNCEPEIDNLGEQLLIDGAAGDNYTSYDVIAYNINNNDTVRTDASKLTSAVLGVFNEPQFGSQKASYVTQVRLSTYNPSFGTNAVVDSVVLVMKPTYAADSIVTTTNEDYIYPNGNVAAKNVMNTYPVSKFGKAKIGGKTKLTINVDRVTDFLDSYEDISYSNKLVNTGETLGSKEFYGDIRTHTITKDEDNSSIFSSTTPAIRIPLSATFFQNMIVDKEGDAELQDASNFIRHFRGIRISVAESDGYLFNFAPNDLEMIMYYKYDKTESGTTTRAQTNISFSLGTGNVHIGQYQYNRSGSAAATALATSSSAEGDAKLFLQGMGGPSVGVRIPATTIATLKDQFLNNKSAIMSAKIRLYTDPSNWTNVFWRPKVFNILQANAEAFTSDLTSLSTATNFSLYKSYDLDKNPTYYDFTVTKTLKDIVENEAENKDLIINLGGFLANSSGVLSGYQYTGRSYAPERAVLVGTDPNNQYRAQVKVIFGTKN